LSKNIIQFIVLLLETQDGENQHYSRSLVPVYEGETPLIAAQRTAYCAYNSASSIPVFDENQIDFPNSNETLIVRIETWTEVQPQHLEILKTYFN
jgi:hypothetical protein